MPYYAVRHGRQTGVYNTWTECENSVKGYSGASYKKFSTLPEAEAFTGQQNPSLSPNPILEPKSRQVLPASQRSIGERNIVYTDGSCLRNGQNGATAGYGVYFPESSRGFSGPLDKSAPQTNQRAELEAVKKAIQYSNNDRRDLEIRTDSDYAVKGLTEWSKNWEKDWSKANVVNKDVFKEIIDLSSKSQKGIYMRHVPGHAGETGNEQAHKLAQQGATK